MIEQSILQIIGSALLGLVTFLKSIKFVQEGEKGIRLRFGKATRDKHGNPKVIEPGFVILIPFADTLKRRHIRQQTIRFAKQDVVLKNGLIFEVNAVVIFRVRDIYKALFEIENVEESIEDLSMGILRDELSKLDHKSIVDTEEISSSLLEALEEKAEEWGIEFMQFKITHCAPTSESANYINAETGVQLKIDALHKAMQSEGAQALKKEGLDPGLAAVILGTPLVATTHSS